MKNINLKTILVFMLVLSAGWSVADVRADGAGQFNEEKLTIRQTDSMSEQHPELHMLREDELSEFSLALAVLANEQPEEALSIALQAHSEYERYQLVIQLLRSWSVGAPASAYAWALGLSDATIQELAKREIAIMWVQTDPAAFLEFTNNLPAAARDELFAQTSVHIAYTLAEGDPHFVLEWAESLHGQARQDARLAAFSVWYTQSPEQALQHREHMLNAEEQLRFLSSIAFDLPEQDLELAHHLFEHSSQEVRSNLSYGLLAKLFKSSELEARQWVDALPRDSLWEDAYLNLVYLISQDRPEEAWKYLQEFHGENRLLIVEQGLWSIASNHPQMVRSLADHSDLDDDVRKILIEVIKGIDNPDFFNGC